MKTLTWMVRVIVALILGTSFYELLHAETLNQYLLLSGMFFIYGVGGVFWIRHLEKVQKEDTRHQDTFAP